jgi:hypothetical protein
MLSFRPDSGSVVELWSASASRLRPSISRLDLPTDCHANDAALFVTGFSLLTPGARVFLELLSPDRNVWSIVRPFSGLGLLEVFFIGGANVAE